MKEDFFKLGYTTYLKKSNVNKKKCTNSIFDKIWKHKFILTTSSIIIMCLLMNFFLIYKFMKIIEMSFIY